MTDTAGMSAEAVIERYDLMKAAADRLVYVNLMRGIAGRDRINVQTWNYQAILEAEDDDLIEFGLMDDGPVLAHGGTTPTTMTGRTRHDRQETPESVQVCDRCTTEKPLKKFPTTRAGRREKTCRECKSGRRRTA